MLNQNGVVPTLLKFGYLCMIVFLVSCSSNQSQQDTTANKESHPTSKQHSSARQSNKKAQKKISPKQQLLNTLSKKYSFAYQFNTISDDNFTFKDAVMLINPDTHQLGILFKAKHQLVETDYRINQTPSDTPEHDWNQFTYKDMLFDWKNQFDDDSSIFISRDADSSDFQTARKTDVQTAVDFAFSDE